MKTVSVRQQDAKHNWYVVDARDQVLGRLATEVAHRLRGKHKPDYTPHVDTGDYIVIIGKTKDELGGSEYFEYIHKFIGGVCPIVDFKGS